VERGYSRHNESDDNVRLLTNMSMNWLAAVWHLQDIILLLVVCTRINRPCILAARLHCLHCCNTIARLWAIYDRPLNVLLYAIHHTILVITISCKGQAAVHDSITRRSSKVPSNLPKGFQRFGILRNFYAGVRTDLG